MRNIESKWLEDFLTLVEFRNFSQAAEARNLSQPAFSRRIRSLEYAVGVELFDRSATPLQLTQQGRLFHAQARNLLSQIESNLNELSGLETNNKAQIHISAAHTLALYTMPAIVQQLKERQIDCMCVVEAIDVDQARTTLREGQSDFILSFHEDEFWQKPFLHKKLTDTRMVPVSGVNEHGEATYQITADVIPLLGYTPTSYFGRLLNRKLAQLPKRQLNTIFMSSMASLLKRLAVAQHGIAWLPEVLIQQELEQKKLVRLDPPQDSPYNADIALEVCLYRTDTRLNAIAETFWNAVDRL